MSRRLRIVLGDTAGPGLALLTLVVVLAVTAPAFATSGNLTNVARTAAIVGLAACGQAIVIITRGLDLSSGSLVALMSVVAVKLLDSGTPAAYAIAFGVALAVGLVNGALIGGLQVPPFLVTLGMLTALHGLASYLVGGISVQAPPSDAFTWLARAELGPVPVAAVIAAVAFCALSVLLHRTTLGRSWYLLGSNPDAARMAGLRVGRLLCVAYVVAAGFVGIAGLVLTARVHSAQPNLQPSLAFEAIAACAIGGLSMDGGTGRVRGVVVGVLVMAVGSNGLVLLNVSDDVQTIAIGLITVGAVVLVQRPRSPLGAARARRARSAAATAANAHEATP